MYGLLLAGHYFLSSILRKLKKQYIYPNVLWYIKGSFSLYSLILGSGVVSSAAEYCIPVWLNRVHDTTLRIIDEMIKSTPVEWVPVLSHIPFPHALLQKNNKPHKSTYPPIYWGC